MLAIGPVEPSRLLIESRTVFIVEEIVVRMSWMPSVLAAVRNRV